MVVCVVDSWDYGASAEVDLFRVRSDESLDFRRVAGSRDSLPTDREGLHIWMRSIAGKDFSVEAELSLAPPVGFQLLHEIAPGKRSQCSLD